MKKKIILLFSLIFLTFICFAKVNKFLTPYNLSPKSNNLIDILTTSDLKDLDARTVGEMLKSAGFSMLTYSKIDRGEVKEGDEILVLRHQEISLTYNGVLIDEVPDADSGRALIKFRYKGGIRHHTKSGINGNENGPFEEPSRTPKVKETSFQKIRDIYLEPKSFVNDTQIEFLNILYNMFIQQPFLSYGFVKNSFSFEYTKKGEDTKILAFLSKNPDLEGLPFIVTIYEDDIPRVLSLEEIQQMASMHFESSDELLFNDFTDVLGIGRGGAMKDLIRDILESLQKYQIIASLTEEQWATPLDYAFIGTATDYEGEVAIEFDSFDRDSANKRKRTLMSLIHENKTQIWVKPKSANIDQIEENPTRDSV